MGPWTKTCKKPTRLSSISLVVLRVLLLLILCGRFASLGGCFTFPVVLLLVLISLHPICRPVLRPVLLLCERFASLCNHLIDFPAIHASSHIIQRFWFMGGGTPVYVFVSYR